MVGRLYIPRYLFGIMHENKIHTRILHCLYITSINYIAFEENSFSILYPQSSSEIRWFISMQILSLVFRVTFSSLCLCAYLYIVAAELNSIGYTDNLVIPRPPDNF